MAKILVVDDDPIMLLACQHFLSGEGYEVLGAMDGLSALEIARKERPDLILLDLMLPKLDGFEVCHMLKADEKFKSIKILMVTGRKDEDTIETSKKVGADGCLTKGDSPQRLVEVIKRLLENQG